MPDLTSTEEIGGCPSDLQLDRMLTGELDNGGPTPVESHLVRCAACGARHAELARQYESFAEAGEDFAGLARRVGERRVRRAARQRRLAHGGALLGGLSLAAVAMLWLVPAAFVPRGERPAPPELTRSKGAPHLGYFVKRGATVTEGASGEVLHPGDRIRFVTSSERASYLAVLNRDGRGVSVYYPATLQAARVREGSGVPLDFSVVLDELLGHERVFALFCERPFAVEPVRASLEARGDLVAPPGCELATIDLEKRQAGP